jgi:ribosomal-protein-alanine N-acetyltransferase
LPEAQILDMAVRRAEQGRGLGKALLEHVQSQARAWGCAKLCLEVSANNEPAQRLYVRAGFLVVGRRRKFYNDGSDAILMDRLLA